MFRTSFGTDPLAAQIEFAVRDVVGIWESREGAPGIRIYRNDTRKAGGYYLELTYQDQTSFHRPIKRFYGNIRYFDLYGYVGLAYDAEREVLQLSTYGEYYRAEECSLP